MENPESLLAGYQEMRENLMARILFTGSLESEKNIERIVYEKLDHLSKEYPHCFQYLISWITGMTK